VKRETIQMAGGRDREMRLEDWIKTVPEEITTDTLWRVEAYRLSLFIAELGWQDATRLRRDGRTAGLSDQLYRALGSISANLAEGYSRGTGRDRARFYEYSLGSAREARDWYYKARYVLGDEVTKDRLIRIVHIIRLLLTMVPDQRGKLLKENGSTYQRDHMLRISTVKNEDEL